MKIAIGSDHGGYDLKEQVKAWGIQKAVGKELFTIQGEYSANMIRTRVLGEKLDEMEPDNPAWFEMALLFYEKLGAQPEEFLEAHAYTQDEVVDGLRYVVDTCGYGDLWDTISR